jgi:hypothetical protein
VQTFEAVDDETCVRYPLVGDLASPGEARESDAFGNDFQLREAWRPGWVPDRHAT